jgi:prepilin-type N-terminal cleavage/methylation domain-containing protein
MLNKIKNRNQEGFTIIEVLIVLAIAGLILLIVFLAVPALQRNSRNTQRKNDVAALLGGVNEYANNNSGKLPVTISFSTVGSATWFFNDSTASTTTGTPVSSGYYNASGDVVLGSSACAAAGCGLTVDSNKVYIEKNAVCVGNTITNAGASSRNYAALYAVEPGNTPQCQQS